MGLPVSLRVGGLHQEVGHVKSRKIYVNWDVHSCFSRCVGSSRYLGINYDTVR